MEKRLLIPQFLTHENFAQFGEVIDLDANALAQNEALKVMDINEGLTKRYHALTSIDASDEVGAPIVSIFHTQPISLPHQVVEMERHPLGSQAFIPLGSQPYYVLCALQGEAVSADDLQLFITNGRQGVNLAKNAWHHFQLVLGEASSYLVIDRQGRGSNLELVTVKGNIWLDRP
ncbi:MAG: ureidoglycolate lyase [Saprospiraceae bacterium]|jgi:ureidoglycolate lyase